MSVSNPTRDDFAAMLEESFAKTDLAEGYVAKGIITAIEKDVAIVDVGLKVEGRVPLKEFGAKAKDGDVEKQVDEFLAALPVAVVNGSDEAEVKSGLLRDVLRLDVPNSTVRTGGFGQRF